MRTILLIVFLLSTTYQLNAQCTFTGISNGDPYSVTLQISPVDIIVTQCNNSGFNYNVEMYYEVTTTGNPPSNLDNFQGRVFCNSQGSFFDLPNDLSITSGTITSVGNQYVGGQNCNDANNATPESLGCNSITINISGPGLSESNVSCPLVVLPIELNYFTAEVTNNQQVQLYWQTLSEVNNDFFTIEYSYNGVNWNNLDTIQGNGTTQVSQNYSYLHTNPLGEEMFYRLKQTDFDGNYTYSDITQVTLEQEINLISYPNPVRDYGIIEYPGNQLITIETVVNVFGKQFTVNAQRLAPNQIQIDFQSLPSGLYFIKTNFGTVKFLKL